MSYDIYGDPLRRGHCEVHPHVHEEYPCSVCVAESRRQQEAQIPAWCDGNPAHCESAHYLGQAQEEIKSLNDEIQALRKDAERMRGALKKIEGMDSMSYHSLGVSKDSSQNRNGATDMTKIQMPDPVGYFACDPETLEPVWDEGCVCQDDIYNQEDFGTIGRPFIFTDQAEAYADARVQKALEEAAQACEARIGQHAPGMTPEDVEDCDEEARLCAAAVRALIPPPFRPGRAITHTPIDHSPAGRPIRQGAIIETAARKDALGKTRRW